MRPCITAAWAIAGLYALDRVLRMVALAHFFRRARPAAPQPWPTVTLLQPITRGAAGLADTLAARARLDYPAPVQHLLICDAVDSTAQAICRAWMASAPQLDATLLLAPPSAGAALAYKIDKLLAALPHARGEVLCFIDDDVRPRPQALRELLPYLYLEGAGAAFGLACYIRWHNLASSLISGFVNANALSSYIPGAYLAEPFTITGHLFALRRPVFEAAGGLAGMEGRFSDDHELARRVRALGLRCVQTPLIYDVANDLAGLGEYAAQIRRWFVLPRQDMLHRLGRRERLALGLVGAGAMLPGLAGLLALLRPCRASGAALAACLALFGCCYRLGERYLGLRTPLRRWPLLALVALLTPLQAALALLADDRIVWRGQRLRALKGGGLVRG